jgi:putative FmdB family regulatory protein
MPIYEYECEECGEQFEVMQKFSDDPLGSCPRCGGRVHKLISQTSFILKGSGWYVTDYARKGGNGDNNGKKGEKAAPTPKTEQKTESVGESTKGEKTETGGTTAEKGS